MKNLIALIFILSGCLPSMSQETRKYLIKIWDADYSLAYTNYYKISNDSIVITFVSGVESEESKTVLSRTLSKDEENKIFYFLSHFPLDSISSTYKNRLIMDGDQKTVMIHFKNMEKTISISNFYQQNVAELFCVINEMLEPNYKIKYKVRKH